MVQPDDFVRRLLEEHGLPTESLVSRGGWSNQDWLAPAHVVRLSSGRFRDAFAHEATILQLLPSALPHATVLAHGRFGSREWMIQARAAGQPLVDCWHRLSTDERWAAVTQLGEALRALHAISLPADFHNPWLTDALVPGGPIANAHHAPPECFGLLLDAAARVPGVDREVLADVGALIGERLDAFVGDPRVLIHTDAHFANVLWDRGRITALLDFETARPAAPDLEQDALLRFARGPQVYQVPNGPPGPTREAMHPVPGWLADAYPEMFSHPRLAARLVVYEALWQLVQLLHFPPGRGPYDPQRELKTLLSEGERLVAV